MTGQTRADSRQKRVYIVSYPRSGNTWVRILLKHSLGFETESVYPENRQSGDIGGLGNAHLTEPTKVELVKTHAISLTGNDDVIYVLRDGRDATASYWCFLREWEKQTHRDFTEFLQTLPSSKISSGMWWAFHVHSGLETEHPHRLLLVRYEDLKNSQEHELGRILAFLGLDPIRPFSDYAAKISFKDLHARVPTYFRSGRIGAWREIFSQADEKFFLAHDLGYLSKLGYNQPNEDARVSLTRSELRSDVLVRSLLHRLIVSERELERKEKIIQGLHAETERRREALEAVTADRDAWEARYQQLSAEYKTVSQSPPLQSKIQHTIELERELEQKEKVIQGLHAETERRREALEEIDRTLQRERAEWAKERKALSGKPLSF